MGRETTFTYETNPGEVWEEDEFWFELSWRIDQDGDLGIRQHFMSPYREGEKITIDDFKKIKLKTAKVLEAEAVPKSKKLLKLQVAVGDERRQIVAGIAEKYSPESIVGKTIVIVANLESAKLMGIESQGMLLAVNDDKGVVSLITSEKESSDGLEVR